MLTDVFIRESVARGVYELSLHADDERLADDLSIDDLEEVLRSATILEDYPEDRRGHSCLVLGYVREEPVHVVCGLTRQNTLMIVTVYRPAPPRWRTERVRNR